jgi:preprotein translocase subunit SecG
MMDIGINTLTFWLNVGFIPIAVALLVLRWRTAKQIQQQERQRPAAAQPGS